MFSTSDVLMSLVESTSSTLIVPMGLPYLSSRHMPRSTCLPCLCVRRLRAPTLHQFHDIGRPKDSQMHRAGLRPLLQHLHRLRHAKFVQCFSQLCSLWRRLESDLDILNTGIETPPARRVLIETLLQLGPFAAFATAVDEIPADGAL